MEPIIKCQTSSKSDMVKTRADNASSVRLHTNASFADILDDDLKREAKRAKKSYEQDATLERVPNLVLPFGRELRASMLSPVLRQRFAHLLT